MKFVPYQLLDGRPSLVVDGSPAPGTVLNVTHWPGYPPPAGIEGDLSAQMAFRLLERPDLVPGEAEAVSLLRRLDEARRRPDPEVARARQRLVASGGAAPIGGIAREVAGATST
ncbi:MAG: DUF6687 family protein [Acidimicrobiales bacterium]